MSYITAALSAQCQTSVDRIAALQCPSAGQCRQICGTPAPSAARCRPQTKDLSGKYHQMSERQLVTAWYYSCRAPENDLVSFRSDSGTKRGHLVGFWSALQCPFPASVKPSAGTGFQCQASVSESVALRCPVHLQCHRLCGTPVPSVVVSAVPGVSLSSASCTVCTLVSNIGHKWLHSWSGWQRHPKVLLVMLERVYVPCDSRPKTWSSSLARL